MKDVLDPLTGPIYELTSEAIWRMPDEYRRQVVYWVFTSTGVSLDRIKAVRFSFVHGVIRLLCYELDEQGGIKVDPLTKEAVLYELEFKIRTYPPHVDKWVYYTPNPRPGEEQVLPGMDPARGKIFNSEGKLVDMVEDEG